MSILTAFDYNTYSIARDYDEVLVPALFSPWADHLVDTHGPWQDLRVLDLAAGTGVVSERLSYRVGSKGEIVAADVNVDMLNMARERCSGGPAKVRFIRSSAQALDLPDAAFDAVVCQQGFQFFLDREEAAAEIYRVLAPGGRIVVSTWLPVTACEFFGEVCAALYDIEAFEIAEMMRRPFDFLDAEALEAPFGAAGFERVDVRQESLPFVLEGGIPHAIETAYATPIGPNLWAMSEFRQYLFREALADRVRRLSGDSANVGRMAANILTAKKPA